MSNFLTNFTTPSNYTYDSNLIDVTGGLAKLKDQRPSNAIFHVNFDLFNSNWDANDSIITPSQTGTPTLVAGKLELAGFENITGLLYNVPALSNLGNKGTVRFKFTPNYTGSGASPTQGIIAILPTSGNANRFLFRHGTTILLDLYDSNGIAVASVGTSSGSFSNWSPVAGTEYEIEVVWDGDAGTIRVFVNGVSFGVKTPGTFTRTGTATKLYVGTNPTYTTANCKFDDITIFNNAQHTGAYTPGQVISPTIYSTATPTIYKTLGDTDSSLYVFTTFTTLLGGSHTGNIAYELSEDGITWKYWNGSAWIPQVSNEYNTLTTVNNNISEFPIDSEKIFVKLFFISNGYQKVEIDSLTIGYVSNLPPLLDAGSNKEVYQTYTLKPFSDCDFSDPDNNIVLAEYKVDGEVDIWTEIPQGSFGTLLEAVKDFDYDFDNLGIKTLQLQITDDNPDLPVSTSDDLLVTVNKFTVNFIVLDTFGNHVEDLDFDAGDGSDIETVSSPFTHEYAVDIYDVIINKGGYSGVNFSLNVIANNQSSISYIANLTNLDDATIEIDILDTIYKGDSFIINGTINQDITNWEIRCELNDGFNSIKRATSNINGGSGNQIIFIDASNGNFRIIFQRDLTSDFQNIATLEIEAHNPYNELRTLISKKIRLSNPIIDWDEIE